VCAGVRKGKTNRRSRDTPMRVKTKPKERTTKLWHGRRKKGYVRDRTSEERKLACNWPKPSKQTAVGKDWGKEEEGVYPKNDYLERSQHVKMGEVLHRFRPTEGNTHYVWDQGTFQVLSALAAD